MAANQQQSHHNRHAAAVLNPCDADLSVVVDKDSVHCCTVSKGGAGYMFGGVRATVGVFSGRWCFSVKVQQPQMVEVGETDYLRTSWVVRVGVSHLSTPVGKLGEVLSSDTSKMCSVGYNSTGRKVSGLQFEQYGEPLGEDNVVTVFLDLHSDPGRVGFAKGATFLGWAFTVPRNQSPHAALYPHVLLRNCSVAMDLSSRPPHALASMGVEDAGGPYQPIANAVHIRSCGCISPIKPPDRMSDCEVLMVVGLPGSGKTQWALDHIRKHPQKRYILLSPEQVLDSMRVLALKRAGAGGGGLEQYWALANSVYSMLLGRACNTPRNYILDQTNVREQSRIERLAPFRKAGFTLRAALAAPFLGLLTMMQDESQSEGACFLPAEVVAQLMSEFVAPQPNGPEGFAEVLLVHPAPPLPAKRKHNADKPAEDTHEKQVARACNLVASQRKFGQEWLRDHHNTKSSAPQTNARSSAAGTKTGAAAATAKPNSRQLNV